MVLLLLGLLTIQRLVGVVVARNYVRRVCILTVGAQHD